MARVRNPRPNPAVPAPVPATAEPSGPPPSPSDRAALVWPAALVLLAIATLVVFARAVLNGWVLFDDPDYVLANPHIRAGLTLDGVRWLMRSPHAGNWHPLTSIVHMLETQVFGLWAGGPHAVSVLLHTLNAVLLAIALRRLTGARWKSLLVAALFALHPLRVESVAWASELKDVLSGTFFMLTLWSYARWAERPGHARFALVVASLALGLLSKPMLVTLPFVLVLLDLWPLGRLRGGAPAAAARAVVTSAPPRNLAGLVLEKWPLFALAAVLAAVTFVVQRSSGAVVAAVALPLATRASNAAISYWRYLGQTVWPHQLVPLYILHLGIPPAYGVLATLALAGATALALWQLPRRPQWFVGWAWYVGMLVPVIGLVQVGMQAHADRYTYLPVIGALVAVVWSAEEFWPPGRVARIVTVVGSCAVLTVFGMATTRQVGRWWNNRTLFNYTLSIDPLNITAHQCLGSELLHAGRVREALPHFELILTEAPGDAEVRENLAVGLAALGRTREAIEHYDEVIRTADGVGVRRNRALALMKLGRTNDAIADYRAALQFDADDVASLVELGAALGTQGRLAEAETALRHAIKLRPEDVKVRRLLAVTLANEGDAAGAVAQYILLLRNAPDDLDALNNVAWIRATHADPRQRNGAEAVRLAERANSLSREPVAVLCSTLAASYAEAGRFPDAVRAGTRAVELARVEGDSAAGARYAQQLAGYRAGRPFHFAR